MQNSKKLALGLGTLAAVSAPIAAISCNMSVNYKPAFFNYEDYMSEDSINKINGKFNYKQFGDLPEFEQALIEKRTIGGIGSDYYNAKWAAKGYIKKIDFHKALHLDYTDKNDLKSKLKLVGYTPQAWKQMESFNGYLKDKHVDVDNDGVIDELWEFMVPYFMQSKVLTFNIKRGNDAWYQMVSKINDQADIDALFPDKTYLGLLKTLKANGYNNFVVNDYARDNMMIGSEYNRGTFTGKLTNSNYRKHIDGFIKTIEEGMKVDIKNGNKVIFETSGAGSLDHLVNPKENWGSAFLYNGDALYAHYGGSNETDEGKNIRTVVPDKPIYLLDGLVLSSIADKNMEDKFYDVVYNGFLKGWSDTLDKGYNKTTSYGDEMPAAANNFDSVNYTTPFKSVYDHFKKGGLDDYFAPKDKTDPYDTFGEEIFNVAPESKMNSDTVISPIDDDLQFKYNKYYISKTS